MSASETIKQVLPHYSSRAANYDNANGGWHIQLGQQFVDWLSDTFSAHAALDLACGTGLVTIPLAKAMGKGARVIGVDINTDMLARARQKALPSDVADIKWIEHDVGSLGDVEEVQSIIKERGGFDIISCCSALVLLHSPAEAIQSWAKMLKPGGKMIIDVPTGDKTLQYIMTSDKPLRASLGLPFPFGRTWIEDIHSLEKLVRDAGLVIEKSWKTSSYLPEHTYGRDQAEKVWEEQMEKYKDFMKPTESGRVEAKKRFLELWQMNLNEAGNFTDGHYLYVTIARKE
jgi:ubiquinone/menaquinone biosynthesis C-methylase UbiE